MGVATDHDLTPLLNRCSDEELQPLVGYILKASTNELDGFPGYKARPGVPSTYVSEIVYEIKTFGGNTFANLFREDGVPYREIVQDVAKRLKLRIPENASIEEWESGIVTKVLQDMLKKMSPEERQRLDDAFAAAGQAAGDRGATLPLSVLLLQGGVNLSGFMAYRLATIVANAVARAVLGRGLSIGANAALMRVLGLATGPIGWVLSALWAAFDLAGPAFRVTLPCVCHVAFLRQKHAYGREL
ncbi:YaaW family protein [Archangium lansingense]|uniref:DUF3944 domain-containing protein n=1 Tax=Archangium lansingense TaxID=2995310 RepID=A0ABT4ALP9_9BACT|nr:ubiquinol-cytochrome C chaperone family protein [Archangium lansinium]MCY1082623.1 hypothetical protein [Archangium lansinium]